MPAGPPTQEHDQPSNILGLPDPPIRRLSRDILLAADHLHQPVSHLAGIEARGDSIAHDPPRPELDGEVLGEVDGGGLAGAVAVGGLGAEGADAEAGDGGGDEDARGVVDGRVLLEQRLELLHRVEDALDVQVHHLGEGGFWVRLEGFAPGGARIGEEDVDVGGGLGDFGDEAFDLGELRAVGGDGVGAGVGGFVGEGIEGGGRGFAGGGFAGGDVDFGAAGLEEAAAFVRRGVMYGDLVLWERWGGRTHWRRVGPDLCYRRSRRQPCL